jgi:hypothetical protein
MTIWGLGDEVGVLPEIGENLRVRFVIHAGPSAGHRTRPERRVGSAMGTSPRGFAVSWINLSHFRSVRGCGLPARHSRAIAAALMVLKSRLVMGHRIGTLLGAAATTSKV